MDAEGTFPDSLGMQVDDSVSCRWRVGCFGDMDVEICTYSFSNAKASFEVGFGRAWGRFVVDGGRQHDKRCS